MNIDKMLYDTVQKTCKDNEEHTDANMREF